MPSDAALEIVNKIFGDEKAAAIDVTNDAIASTTYDMIQAKKLEFAKQMGFDLADTAQDAADEVEKSIEDVGDAEVTDATTDARQPHEAPAEDEMNDEVPDPLPPNTAVVDSIEPIEEPKNETDS
tara:strand:- start:158 stop:532 length:375 start_codon:yes stop_codon:yes gene_type:complete